MLVLGLGFGFRVQCLGLGLGSKRKVEICHPPPPPPPPPNRNQMRYSRFFLQSPHCAENRIQHVRSSGHAQHIERLSRATCRATCHVVRKNSSDVKFGTVEIAFIRALFIG